MVKSILVILSFMLSSCGVQTMLLENGRTKVPIDRQFFSERIGKNYNIKKPRDLDSCTIFIEKYHQDKKGNKFYRTDGYYSAYVFYANGNVNSFGFKHSKDSLDLNPKKNGYRGVSYVDDGQQHIAMFIPINVTRDYGISKKEIMIKGDTLLVNGDRYFSHIYVKDDRPFPKFNADW